MARSCLECGAEVSDRDTRRHGPQPRLCSPACQLQRRRKTTKRWIQAHREQKLANDAECRKRHKEAKPDYFKQHYAKYRERRKQESQDWYRKNAEYALQRQKVYTAKRPIELRRALGRKSRSKRRAIELRVFVEAVDSRVVFERDKGICGICKSEVDVTSPWEVDHIVPISKGGAHAYVNVQLAHRKCNRSKAAKNVIGIVT